MARAKCLALALFLLAALQSIAQTQTPAKTAVKSGAKLGFLIADLRQERWQTDVEQFTIRAGELDATVLTRDARSDADVQLDQAKELISKGVKVLVVNSVDGDKAAELVSYAHKHGVPVVCYDRMILGGHPDFFLSYDSERIGELQAEYLLKVAPQGNYVLLEGSSTDDNATLFYQGHLKVLKAAADSGTITVVTQRWVKDWSETEAYMEMMKALAVSKNIQAVVAANDSTASGAAQALLDMNVKPFPVISGQDSDLSAVVRIIKGTQTMSIYKPMTPLARLGAEAAVELAKGKKPASQIMLSNGDSQVPAVLLTPKAVDRSNLMQTVFADKFQSAAIVQKELTEQEWQAFAAQASNSGGSN